MKMTAITLTVLVALAGAALVGCNPKTIYVPHGEAVRLRETLKGVKVWVVDADGKPVAGKIDLPEGWYCLPDPGPAANLFADEDEAIGRSSSASSSAGWSREGGPPARDWVALRFCRQDGDGHIRAGPGPPGPAQGPARGPGAMIRSPTPLSSEDPVNGYACGPPA